MAPSSASSSSGATTSVQVGKYIRTRREGAEILIPCPSQRFVSGQRLLRTLLPSPPAFNALLSMQQVQPQSMSMVQQLPHRQREGLHLQQQLPPHQAKNRSSTSIRFTPLRSHNMPCLPLLLSHWLHALLKASTVQFLHMDRPAVERLSL